MPWLRALRPRGVSCCSTQVYNHLRKGRQRWELRDLAVLGGSPKGREFLNVPIANYDEMHTIFSFDLARQVAMGSGEPPGSLPLPEDATPWYVVFRGRVPGIYSSWRVCQDQVNGYSNNSYRRYTTLEEAQQEYLTYLQEELLEDHAIHDCRGIVMTYAIGWLIDVVPSGLTAVSGCGYGHERHGDVPRFEALRWSDGRKLDVAHDRHVATHPARRAAMNAPARTEAPFFFLTPKLCLSPSLERRTPATSPVTLLANPGDHSRPSFHCLAAARTLSATRGPRWPPLRCRGQGLPPVRSGSSSPLDFPGLPPPLLRRWPPPAGPGRGSYMHDDDIERLVRLRRIPREIFPRQEIEDARLGAQDLDGGSPGSGLTNRATKPAMTTGRRSDQGSQGEHNPAAFTSNGGERRRSGDVHHGAGPSGRFLFPHEAVMPALPLAPKKKKGRRRSTASREGRAKRRGRARAQEGPQMAGAAAIKFNQGGASGPAARVAPLPVWAEGADAAAFDTCAHAARCRCRPWLRRPPRGRRSRSPPPGVARSSSRPRGPLLATRLHCTARRGPTAGAGQGVPPAAGAGVGGAAPPEEPSGSHCRPRRPGRESTSGEPPPGRGRNGGAGASVDATPCALVRSKGPAVSPHRSSRGQGCPVAERAVRRLRRPYRHHGEGPAPGGLLRDNASGGSLHCRP
ncbi:hypothetical protein QYE76_039027 [Lolium multiflorum]|uniref:Ribonuclease H n=1 Tax=Lolium multiflorum TaxID=4521 RepID=A0AAD8TAB8_LOLMU|nr:hypothetical protein QYE76_039027 [Lolium multiflorum]